MSFNDQTKNTDSDQEGNLVESYFNADEDLGVDEREDIDFYDLYDRVSRPPTRPASRPTDEAFERYTTNTSGDSLSAKIKKTQPRAHESTSTIKVAEKAIKVEDDRLDVNSATTGKTTEGSSGNGKKKDSK